MVTHVCRWGKRRAEIEGACVYVRVWVCVSMGEEARGNRGCVCVCESVGVCADGGGGALRPRVRVCECVCVSIGEEVRRE